MYIACGRSTEKHRKKWNERIRHSIMVAGMAHDMLPREASLKISFLGYGNCKLT